MRRVRTVLPTPVGWFILNTGKREPEPLNTVRDSDRRLAGLSGLGRHVTYRHDLLLGAICFTTGSFSLSQLASLRNISVRVNCEGRTESLA